MSNNRWKENYEDVCTYINEHHCSLSDIPEGIQSRNGITLKNWIREQYRVYFGKTSRMMSAERRENLHSIGIEQYLDTFGNAFYKALMEVKQFYAEHGHVHLPKTMIGTSGTNLSAWVRIQRNRYRNGTLKSEYLQMIQEADMMVMMENPFDTAYRHALEFHRVYGNLNMPTSYVCTDGFALGKWCTAMRERRKNGTVSDEKIKLLDALGFDWNTAHQQREITHTPKILSLTAIRIQYENEQGVIHAEQYYQEHHTLDNISADYVCADGFQLGKWLDIVRIRYRKKGLPTDIVSRLKKLNMKWNSGKSILQLSSRMKNFYEDGISRARVFSAENHHLNVPKDYVCDDGFALGKWISTMRDKYHNDKLSPEIIVNLEEIGIIWSLQDIKWFEVFEECRVYLQDHPDAPIPRDIMSTSGVKLNLWFRHNHTNYQNGLLSPERAKLFSMIDFDPVEKYGNKFKAKWDANFEDVVSYLRQHPEYDVSNFPLHVKGTYVQNLSVWFYNQCRAFQMEDSSLIDEQRDKLRLLGVDKCAASSKGDDGIWQTCCMALKAFYDEYGHTQFPADKKDLKEWFWTQRGLYKRGAYSFARLQFLEENGLTELFSSPLRGQQVIVNLKMLKPDYDALMEKVKEAECDTLEDYLLKLAKD